MTWNLVQRREKKPSECTDVITVKNNDSKKTCSEPLLPHDGTVDSVMLEKHRIRIRSSQDKMEFT